MTRIRLADSHIVYALAAVAFLLSYSKLLDLAERAGYGSLTAHAWPLIVDGLALIAARAVERGRGGSRYAWSMLIAGTAVSILAAVLSALVPPGPLPPAATAAVTIIPPLALPFALHLARKMRDTDAATPGVAAPQHRPTPAAAPHQTAAYPAAPQPAAVPHPAAPTTAAPRRTAAPVASAAAPRRTAASAAHPTTQHHAAPAELRQPQVNTGAAPSAPSAARVVDLAAHRGATASRGTEEVAPHTAAPTAPHTDAAPHAAATSAAAENLTDEQAIAAAAALVAAALVAGDKPSWRAIGRAVGRNDRVVRRWRDHGLLGVLAS